MTMAQYVARYINAGNRARWNSLSIADRKRAVANVSKEVAPLSMKAYVAKYINACNRARWNALSDADKKRAVANTPGNTPAPQSASKSLPAVQQKAAPKKRYDSESVKNFWATAGPTWGDGSPMQ